MRSLVIIPTYNEKENISLIINEIWKALVQDANILNETDILVVDDNSPDGTAEIVKSLQQQNKKIHLLQRPGKQGLGKAYIAGFKWGIENQYDILVEMDADFSHRPIDLFGILKHITSSNNHDFVVGSRYVRGGSTVNWGILRKIISRGGGIYSRVILGYNLNDWTGGFNAWKKSVLLGIDYLNVKSEGYSFQIELKYKAMKNKFKGYEYPIKFEDRRVGQSKMSLKIVLEAFYRVWMMRFQ